MTKSNNTPYFFVAKYDNDLNHVWALDIPKTSNKFNRGLAVDLSGAVYVSGSSTDGVVFGDIPAQDGGIFLAKLGNGELSTTDYASTSTTAYPNPVQNFLTITNDNAAITSVAVFNTLGQRIRTKSFNNNSTTVSIDMSSLETGMYLVEIKTESGAYKKKIFKR